MPGTLAEVFFIRPVPQRVAGAEPPFAYVP
jgi:hypothetical protein